MRQPAPPNSTSHTTTANAAPAAANDAAKKNPKPPAPEEILAHYESQGLEPRDAALRAIGELQAALYRSVVSGRRKKQKFAVDSLRKLDNANARLAVVEAKLDAKPNLAQSLAVGVFSGAFVQGVGAAMPHVFGGLLGVWDSARAATRSSS